MKIVVGSMNAAKIQAVMETIELYDFLRGAQVQGVETESGIEDQPKSFEQIVKGAKNRAQRAFVDCDYSIGIESGFHKFPLAGYMELTVCAIYDGKEFYYGISPAFKCPEEVEKFVFEDGMNLSVACHKAGLSQDEHIGKAQGIIGILTKNRKKRKDYTKDAIIMALIPIENSS